MKIVIAGPGAGKTHNMINHILKVLPEIQDDPHRICAVITYTNATTEEIKERLSRKISIPKNIFIGTSHSFLIHYIIELYYHLFYKIDDSKIFIDRLSLPYKPSNYFAGKNAIISLVTSFVERGIITYDKILDLSFELIKKEKLLNNISKRLSHVFVDEYQDTHTYLHDVLMKIIQKG